ncbi:hypothetical protein GALMADRAFT_267117 [Galerina marginata CBS 339.88]|uniref:BZIP domain-containing protein n=1 Tax=Galerina marginata (strain CBS 339.88) TaxID=685588 RepID=A0A067TD22_GALM3|nr:hypothetical protein GALMADRAFT_267117 [Galerina marginata CBS 339.88]
MSSSVTSHTAHSERPERSRNAKAQARHRAKRKAYIDQLETTVTKLQIAVGYTTEQISALPPPLLKIRELEQDNARLQKENDELRRLLTDPSSRTLSSDSARRTSIGGYQDTRGVDRDYNLKRRKAGHQDGVYISPSDTPPHGGESSRPPPPLTIPQPLSHHYGNMSSSSVTHGNNNNQGGLFNLHAPAFQMPNTPSGSSATSSPPFSATPSHLPMDHRPHISDHHAMPSYPQPAPSHYSSVKVEDDHYNAAGHSNHHSSMQYSYSNSQSQNHNGMDWQHNAYSSERAPLHR